MIPNFTVFFGVSSNLAGWLTSGATLISGITIPMTAFTLGSLAAYSMAAMVSSVIGPTYAGLIMDVFGWQAPFYQRSQRFPLGNCTTKRELSRCLS